MSTVWASHRQRLRVAYARHARVVALALFVGLSGCARPDAADEGDPVGSTSQGIQGGQVESGFIAVGEVSGFIGKTLQYCTGTLISPSTVLTAQHCASDKMTFTYTDDPYGNSSHVYHVVEQIPHPSRDMMLLRLDRPVLDVPPMRVDLSALAYPGRTCTEVGYGDHTESNGSDTRGVRRSCTVYISATTVPTIVVGRVTGIANFGDSGGPLVCNGDVVGIAYSVHIPEYNSAQFFPVDTPWILAQLEPSTNLFSREAQTGLSSFSSVTDGGTVLNTSSLTHPLDPGWQFQGTGDFDGDRQTDVLWRNADGQALIWYIWGGNAMYETMPGGQDPNHTWNIQGVGDFDGNGEADILWRNTEGQLWIWFNVIEYPDGYVGSNAYVGYARMEPRVPVDLSWQVRGVADFDGDGRADILWQHVNGNVSIWYMFGPDRLGDGNTSMWDPNAIFRIQTLADFNADGRADILWRKQNDGSLAIWFGGLGATSAPVLYQNKSGPVDSAWQVKGAADFDRNGSADILWQHDDGLLAIWLMSGAAFMADVYPGNLGTGSRLQTTLTEDAPPVTVQPVYRSVPDVIGMAPSDAGRVMSEAGFSVVFTSKTDSYCEFINRVMGESPHENTGAPYGSTVQLILGARPTGTHVCF